MAQQLSTYFDGGLNKISLTNRDEDLTREDCLVLNIPQENLRDYHLSYKKARYILPIINYLFCDYEAGKLIMEGKGQSLGELFSDPRSRMLFMEQSQGKYHFTFKMKDLMQKLLEAFNYLYETGLYFGKSSLAKNVVFLCDDVTYEFPKLVLEKRTHNAPSHDEENAKTNFRMLAQLIVALINSARLEVRNLALAETSFLNLLNMNVYNIGNFDIFKRLRNHPALWHQLSSSRYMIEAKTELDKKRTRIALRRSSHVTFSECLPADMSGATAFGGKYNSWQEKIKKDAYIHDFFEYSTKWQKSVTSYTPTVDGLFRFKRNAYAHFFEDTNSSDDGESSDGAQSSRKKVRRTPSVVNRFELSMKDVEQRFSKLFPDFINDVHEVLTSTATFVFEESPK